MTQPDAKTLVAPLVSVEGLSICFGIPGRSPNVVEDVDFTIAPGEVVAVVGESGSGKTLTGRSLMGLLPRAARVSAGRAMFQRADGRSVDLLSLGQKGLRALRGTEIAMVFQEPMSALSPLHRVGDQVAEPLRVHEGEGAVACRKRVLDIFAEVGFPDPERAYRAYPFELSGGLRQRAVIAMAMVSNPRLVIADEPTTALDVTTQAQVLELITRLQKSHGMAVLMISHDLGVVANMAHRIMVMRKGRVVESGAANDVLHAPGHGYTRALIAAAPKPSDALPDARPVPNDPIMEGIGLSKTYPGRSRMFGPDDPPFRAVSDLTLRVGRGETVAVVGESGSGKSTIAKLLLRAERPDSGGAITFRPRDGAAMDVITLSGDKLSQFRQQAQMVFQDPYSALSPRMSVLDILAEPLLCHGKGTPKSRKDRAAELMERVGLSAAHLGRFPHAFSGGQRQRIAIARALALQPELLVCDEPTSALDVSVQAEVLDLLVELREELGLSYLFISHDLAVVARIADRVAVMRRGHVVEEGPAAAVLRDPRHPYTCALMAASPEPDCGKKLDLKLVAKGAGAPESWADPFGYRDKAHPLVEVAPGHRVRCAA